jgi:hypothetical protein
VGACKRGNGFRIKGAEEKDGGSAEIRGMSRMRNRTECAVAAIGLLLIGGGCFKKPEPAVSYIPAGSSSAISVSPNPEGGDASTGGNDVTVTPQLNTPLMVDALPDPAAFSGTVAGEPKENKNPIPLPDGTRDEYTSVERTYTKGKGTDAEVRIHVTVSDTRGIPVLSAFVDNFNEFSGPDGYRKKTSIANTDAWILYTYDPEKNRNGFGGLTMFYRGRFLIQIDGTLGVTEDELTAYANAVDFTKFQ